MKKQIIWLLLWLMALLIAPTSSLALTYEVYTNLESFKLAAKPLSVYDFENDAVGGDYRIHDFGSFSTHGSSLYKVDIENENTHELHFNTSSYTQNMSVTFDEPITAFGFDWRNTDNNDDMVRVTFDGTTYVLGSKDQSGFWGIVASEGKIGNDMDFRFGDTNGGHGWTEGNLDNFLYSVPEPTTLLLLGFGGLVLRRKR